MRKGGHRTAVVQHSSDAACNLSSFLLFASTCNSLPRYETFSKAFDYLLPK